MFLFSSLGYYFVQDKRSFLLDLMDAAGLGDKNMDGAVRITTFLLIYVNYVATLVFLVFLTEL
jgi:hypothetical protein